MNRPLARSTTPTPSAFLSAGGRSSSRTLGPPIGEPLRATYSVRPSRLTWIPRGRLPTGIVETTLFVPPSMMLMSLERSLETYTLAGAAAFGCGDDVALAGADE